MTGLVPSATLAIPAMASILSLILMIEFDRQTALISYFSVSFLATILVADKEAVLMFIFFFGHYPIVKSIIERITNIVISYIIKFAFFNTCIIAAYLLALEVFGMGQLMSEFEELAFWGSLVMLVSGNITFFMYDYTLTIMVPTYFAKIRPRLR